MFFKRFTTGVKFGTREKGSFPLSNNYLDDVFTLEDLLGMEKTLAKNLL